MCNKNPHPNHYLTESPGINVKVMHCILSWKNEVHQVFIPYPGKYADMVHLILKLCLR